jgi:hypothetical protein
MKKCYLVPEPWHRNVVTFAPDDAAFACYPRAYDCGQICTSPTGCTFGTVNFQSEFKNNLTAIGWDKLLQSFDCFLNSTVLPARPGGDPPPPLLF